MCKHLSLILAALCLSVSLAAQTRQADRVAAQPELTTSVRLAGHVPRWAAAANDAGPVDGATPLHLTFVLSRAPGQQAAFDQLLADQQDPASPRYHQWLTPRQAGDFFGPTRHDVDALTTWLSTHGLPGAELSPDGIFLTLTAPADPVAAALSTSFHTYTLGGKPRVAATQEPALPSGFVAIVSSIEGLSDPVLEPTGYGESVAAPSASTRLAQPRIAINGSHYIAPADFASIFNLNPAFSQGYKGVGQRIAIIGRSRVALSDITEFEIKSLLPANVPNTIVPGSAPDPGYTANGDQLEATIDVGRAMTTAPYAQIDLVILPNSAGGIFSAAQYAVNTLNDPVMNISFGSCELNTGPSGVKSWDTLFAQAAAQGISVTVSAADAGAATCDPNNATPPAIQSRSINTICASSYATCVGGTEFADPTPSVFWNDSGSAFGYIPEGAWNEPTSTNSSGVVSYIASSGGGGTSLYIPKPSWQMGTGVPADSARDVPDVSFPASAHDGYYACYAAGNGDCASGRFEYFYGTSAGAPSMAAIIALLNQRTGTRQGNVNPLLYRFGGSPSNNVFHDATVASSGVGNCSLAIPSMCNNSTPSPTSLTGGEPGFLLTTGYDQATGWGSLNVGNLFSASGPASANSVNMYTVATASTIPVGTSATVTTTVITNMTATQTATPTGYVQFFLNGVTVGPAIAVPATGVVSPGPITLPSAQSYAVNAVYSGDSVFSPNQASISVLAAYPGFSIATLPNGFTLNAGATSANTAQIVYTSIAGFTGAINQTCTVTYNGSGTPSYVPICSFTAPTVFLAATTNPNAPASVTGILTINSTVPHFVTAPGSARRAGLVFRAAPDLPTGFLLASLAMLSIPASSRRGLRKTLALGGTLTIALLALSACGGSSSTPSQPPLVGTTAGSYTISITSSSGSVVSTPSASLGLAIN